MENNDCVLNLKDFKLKANKEYVIYTGEAGADKFDTFFRVYSLTHDDLKNEYIKCRDELFKVKRKLNKLNNNWFINFLIKCKIIKNEANTTK